jgi:hypothetical protein
MLKDALMHAMSAIPDCAAAGVVDLTTGTLLELAANEDRSQELLNVMATAVTELFEAPLLRLLSQIWVKAGGDDELSNGGFNEVILLNEELSYVLLRGLKNGMIAVIFVASKTTSLGMLLLQARTCLTTVEDEL